MGISRRRLAGRADVTVLTSHSSAPPGALPSKESGARRIVSIVILDHYSGPGGGRLPRRGVHRRDLRGRLLGAAAWDLIPFQFPGRRGPTMPYEQGEDYRL